MYMEKVIHFTLNSLFLECMCTRNKDGTKNLVLHGAQLFKRIKRRIINEDISIILNFLKDKPKIKHLYLPYNSITSEGFREIVQFLEENENILTLNIMNNDIDERGIRSLARLRNTMKLTSLRINGNPIGAKGGKYLGFLLLHNNSLRSLDVSQSDQTIESLVYLTAVLQYENNTLEKLNLSRVLGQWYYTLLSDHVAQKLSKMFSTNTSLKEVHLEKLFLTDHDIEILVYGLMYNNTLEVLNLSCNQIGDYGIECLSEYLGKGPPLKKLMIHHNHIGNTGARMPRNKATEETDKLTRIAIVNSDKCKPKRCRQECKKSCPVVRMGKLCIEVTPNDKIAVISEELCIGCGICVKKCPFEAITIINLPSNLEKDTTHRYSQNSFKLHRLPIPRPGEVLGLVGTNGIGKSTALKILAGKQKPNLGRYVSPPDWSEILNHFRGSELQNYFTKILEDDLKALIKPQYVDQIPRAVKGTVQQLLDKKDERDNQSEICDLLDLQQIRDRSIEDLSGGELQRFACAMVCIQAGDIFMFDEPSSYLDVKQRLKAAITIRSLIQPDKFIIVVEHDLSVLDYLSDFICCLYGVPGAYGVVTMPFSVREGINIFLDGFVPTENLRFRDESLVFKVAESATEEVKRMNHYEYPSMTKTMGQFKLTVNQGQFTDSEILVLLGENGTGKTTFIRMLAGNLPADEGSDELPHLNISYKPQKISPKSTGIVRQLLHEKIRDAYVHPQFITDVMKPLKIDDIMDQEVQNLSGGELQRVAMALCLGKPADVYLIDEPSAYLDSEQRLVAAKVIKRFILHAKKTGFVVEHDFIMATYLADRVIVFEGIPSIDTTANTPQSLLAGMNRFLELLGITFRRDPNNFRPRINKNNSVKDVEQKRAGQYFFLED
uniref:ATP-binding cassette sub-family E member 1 n=2 Tax=Clastoptera arizonana TaxID=38151 RepID=A0A1B6DQG0_9HEMI